MKDGTITWQRETFPEELLPEPHPPKAKSPCIRKVIAFKSPSPTFEFSIAPRKPPSSSVVTRRHSTSSLKKTGDWLIHKPYVQLLVDAESEDINAKTQNVLDKENQYNQILDMYLAQAGLLELRRKEIQHKRWTDCVAEPLKKIIDGHIDGQSSEDLERKKQFLREQYEQYLKYCNIKGSVFMRDYDSSEYNPLLLAELVKNLRVSTPPFRDPLLFQLQKRIEEERIALRCETGRVYSAKDIRAFNLPRVPLGRQDLNSKDWIRTPFGFIESEIRLKSRQKVRGTFNKGTMDFKAWRYSGPSHEPTTTEAKI